MTETKKSIGAEILTAHDQLIDFINLCNAVKTKEGVLGTQTEVEDGRMMFSESRDVQKAETELTSVDSDVVKAIKFIYGRPNISHIDIPNLDLNKNEDLAIFMEINGILKEDKINEAIKLTEEAMVDEENFLGIPGVAISGIKDAKEVMSNIKPLQEAYAAMGEEKKKQAEIELEKSKLVDLRRSREFRMEDVASYDRQIAAREKAIKKLRGETKKEVDKVVSLEDERAKRKPAEAIPVIGEAQIYDFEPEMMRFIDSLPNNETKKTIMDLMQRAATELPEDKLQVFIDTLKELIGSQPPTPPRTPPPIARALRPPEEGDRIAA